MRHLDLFSGIGGFALAARWMGWQTVAFCEIEPFCRKVLARNFPGIPIHGDVLDFDGKRIGCDIVTCGFPCQPFSSASAGRARGKDDDRFLWPEVRRIVDEARPSFVVAENVPHLDRLALGQVVSDLESIEYEVGILEIPACAVGFDHRRNRLWILGHADRNGDSVMPVDAEVARVPRNRDDARSMAAPDGLSARLAAIGNAIVPQVAYQLFRAIEDCR